MNLVSGSGVHTLRALHEEYGAYNPLTRQTSQADR
jgi:hypothetical protein